MSDAFYKFARRVVAAVFWMTERPVVMGVERVPVNGRCLIAATHQSPYDVPLLMRHTPRLIDFVSIVEVFRNPLVAWLYGSLNAFPLDRSRRDAKTVRIILERLEQGRAVGIFPEGGLRSEPESVVRTRRIRPGSGRIAQMAGAPVVPCVIINSAAYCRFLSWLPLRAVRYGIIYGDPIDPSLDPEAIELRLVDAFGSLHSELSGAMARPR
jgi:1-acyl-sn-glycerol-3-phosphate acyltransferase